MNVQPLIKYQSTTIWSSTIPFSYPYWQWKGFLIQYAWF